MPSSVRIFMTSSVLSPSARRRFKANCFVFLGSLGIWVKILSLNSEELAPITLSWAFIWYLFPVAALWTLSLNSSTFAFCINRCGASIGLFMSSFTTLSLSFAMSLAVCLPSRNLLSSSANNLLSLCRMISLSSNIVKCLYHKLGVRTA